MGNVEFGMRNADLTPRSAHNFVPRIDVSPNCGPVFGVIIVFARAKTTLFDSKSLICLRAVWGVRNSRRGSYVDPEPVA